MRDGSVRTGNQLKHLDNPQGSIELDGQRLLESQNPLRTLHDTEHVCARPKSYLELTNGDVLSGHVVGAVIGDQTTALPDHFVVGEVPHTGTVRVRLDCVRRIVATEHTKSQWTPNYLRHQDGREVRYRSIRWLKSGIKSLTDEGVLSAEFRQIADLHLSPPQAWWPLYAGAAWLTDQSASMVRTLSVEGQAFTYPTSMVTTNFDKKIFRRRSSDSPQLFATRPHWSLDVILLDSESVVMQTYFDPGEWPLSLLPVVDVKQKKAIHHFPWKRNCNVHGGLLHSGEVVSQLGIGMHTYSRLTFYLPDGGKTFTSQVGLNQSANTGGCVHCRIWKDEPTGSPLWEKRFLRGADGVQKIGPLDIAGAKQLILEVDFANENRPRGADPLDVRDFVDWLLPIVHVETNKEDFHNLAHVVPEIAGWSISAEQLQQIELRPFWVRRNNQWGMAMATGAEPLVLTKEVRVALTNAWLPVRSTCDDIGETRTFWVQANGEKVHSTMNGDRGTHDRHGFGQRVYNLREHAGETTVVEVIADPHKNSQGELGGVVWDWLRMRPLIRNLPSNGEPIRPDILLTSLSPTKVLSGEKHIDLIPGKLTTGGALNVHNWPFEVGYGVPTGSDITYRLDPTWQRFVAIIGLADGWQGAGPYEILLDGELHWSNAKAYARNDPGEQISVSIPPGHKTVTLRVHGTKSSAAWAHAGFLK